MSMREQIQEFLEALERGRRFVTHDIWHIGRPGEEVPHGLIIKQIRVVILLVQGVLKETFLLRAAALTFYTTLSIVPLLALMFFVIQAFNVGSLSDELVRRLSTRMEELGIKEELPEGGGEQAAEGEEPPDGALGEQNKNEELLRKFLTLVIPEDIASGNGDQSTPEKDGEPEEGASQQQEDPVAMIMEFAGKGANPQSLGVLGIVFVVTTAFGLMMNIEGAFNSIWGLRRTRSWYRMFSDYIVIIILIPFLVGLIIGCNAFLQAQLTGFLWFALKASQYVSIWMAFTVLYFAVPSTKVKLRYALLAGIVAGSLWTVTAWLFFKFQYGLARYSLVYSGFALFPMILMWVYFSWVIVLFGAELTFACQNEKTFAMERLASGASFAYREALGLRTMIDVGRRFDQGLPPLAVTESAEAWNVPTRLINDTLDHLEEAGLVLRCATDPPTYQPSRSLSRIRVRDVLAALRGAGRDPSDLRKDEALRPLLDEVDGKNSHAMNSSLTEVMATLPDDLRDEKGAGTAAGESE